MTEAEKYGFLCGTVLERPKNYLCFYIYRFKNQMVDFYYPINPLSIPIFKHESYIDIQEGSLVRCGQK